MDDNFRKMAKDVRWKNQEFLASQAESWFGVLFNLFTSAGVTKDEHGPVGDVIRVWCGIASPDVRSHFTRTKVWLLTEFKYRY